MTDDRLYLEHILEAGEKVLAYCEGGRDSFFSDSMIQDAVIRNFEIIGEASRRLSDDVKLDAPRIPWRDVGAFRNVLIHNYMGVDLEEVWNIITDHLPTLIETVRDLLKS